MAVNGRPHVYNLQREEEVYVATGLGVRTHEHLMETGKIFFLQKIFVTVRTTGPGLIANAFHMYFHKSIRKYGPVAYMYLI